MTRIPLLALLLCAFAQSGCVEAKPQAAVDFEHIILKTGKQPGPVAFGDFNGDGHLDVAIGNKAEQTVSIFLSQGNGRFVAAQGSPFPAGPEPNDIAVADVNNDGKLDLVIANHGSPYVTVLLGKGDGTFVSSLASPIDVHVRPHPHAVAIGDFNHDGNVDLAVESWADNEIKIFLGDGRGGFRTPGESFKVGKRPYQRLRTADLNGDGNPDIITTNFDESSVSVLLGDGKGGFQPAAAFPAGDNPFAVVIADMNGDGKPDLAVANFSGHGTDFSKDAVNILYGDGTGRFRRGPKLTTGHCPVMIAAGDVNGSGAPDVAVANMCADSVTLLLNHRGRFDRTDIAVGHHPEGIGIAPLFAVHKQSIVVTNQQDDTAEILTLRPRR